MQRGLSAFRLRFQAHEGSWFGKVMRLLGEKKRRFDSDPRLQLVYYRLITHQVLKALPRHNSVCGL